MKSIVTLAMAAVGSCRSILPRQDGTPTGQGVQKPSTLPIFGQITSQGCYASLGTDLTLMDGVQFPTIGGCATDTCQAQGFLISASSAKSQCYCGDKMPPKNTRVDDKLCNAPCNGFPSEACGNLNGTIFTVYNTGKSVKPEFSPDENPEPANSNTKPTSGSATNPTAPPATVTQIAPENSSTGGGGGGGSNTAGIAAGVVIGVLAIAGIVGGVLFYMRRKRNREIEDEHRRNAAVNSFMNGGKPPGSSGGLSNSDSRIDPVMAQRRASNGSIADNEDYSRKILRVTNA